MIYGIAESLRVNQLSPVYPATARNVWRARIVLAGVFAIAAMSVRLNVDPESKAPAAYGLMSLVFAGPALMDRMISMRSVLPLPRWYWRMSDSQREFTRWRYGLDPNPRQPAPAVALGRWLAGIESLCAAITSASPPDFAEVRDTIHRKLRSTECRAHYARFQEPDLVENIDRLLEAIEQCEGDGDQSQLRDAAIPLRNFRR